VTTTSEASSEDDSGVFQLFTVQTEGIQQYTLFAEVCLPVDDDEEDDDDDDEEEAGSLQMVSSRSPPLMTPADVHQHAAVKRSQDAGPSETASDAASPYRPTQDGLARDDDDDEAPPAPSGELAGNSLGGARGVGGGGSCVASDRGSSGPSAPAAREAPAKRGAGVKPSTGPSQMPPQPTLLVKKLSAAGSGTFQYAPESLPSAFAATAGGEEGVTADSEVGVSDLAEEVDSAADAAVAAMVAAVSLSAGAGGSPLPAAAAGSSTVDLAHILAVQQQLLTHLVSSQRETVKMLKQELAKSAKASEAAMAKAVETAVKAQAKQVRRIAVQCSAVQSGSGLG